MHRPFVTRKTVPASNLSPETVAQLRKIQRAAGPCTERPQKCDGCFVGALLLFGSVTAAAKALNIPVRTAWRRAAKLGIGPLKGKKSAPRPRKLTP